MSLLQRSTWLLKTISTCLLWSVLFCYSCPGSLLLMLSMTPDTQPSPPQDRNGLCIWVLHLFPRSGCSLLIQEAPSRVCSILLLLCEVESYQEPLPAAPSIADLCLTLCFCHIWGSRSVSHPVLPSPEDFSNAGRRTRPEGNPSRCSAQKFTFRTVKAGALIAGGLFSSVMVLF